MLPQLRKDLETAATPERAKAQSWFFKTGKGQYGEGDVFLGVTVPEQRAVARKHRSLPLKDIGKLLASRIHEHRLTGLLILVGQFPSSPKEIVRFYLSHLDRVNNWDLVDLTAPRILGAWLLEHPEERAILNRLARGGLWERRVAIIATLAFIRRGQFQDTLRLAELLLRDREDLIHKAVGWMLREVGKRNQEALEGFLAVHAPAMPRTALRYALERLPERKRRLYMKKCPL